MLAELVKAGKLPPVEQRVAQEPLVIKPLHEIGKYGGTWRRASPARATTATASAPAAARTTSCTWTTPATRSCRTSPRAGRSQDGGKTTVLQLRKGMKWSDGEPFTADDFMFWFEDIYSNKDLIPTPIAADDDQRQARQDREGRRVRPSRSSSRTRTSCCPSCCRSAPRSAATPYSGKDAWGGYAPAHYLKQFHPKYAAQDKVDKMAKDASFDNWVSYFKFKNDWSRNPDLPVVTPWKTVTPSPPRSGRWSATRTASGSTPTATSFRTSTRSS